MTTTTTGGTLLCMDGALGKRTLVVYRTKKNYTVSQNMSKCNGVKIIGPRCRITPHAPPTPNSEL